MKAIARRRPEAEGLLERIAKHRPGRQFEVYALPNRKTGEIEGFQVAEIKRVGWWGNSPLGAPLAALEARKAGRAITASEIVLATVTLPLHEETKAYVGVTIQGKVAWFGRGNLVNLSVGGGQVTMTLPRKALVKRGFEELVGC